MKVLTVNNVVDRKRAPRANAAENLQNLFIQASAFTEDFDVEEEDYVETMRQKLKTLRSEVARKDDNSSDKDDFGEIRTCSVTDTNSL